MQAKAHRICVLGSANVDSFVYVKHIPVPGETIQADKYMIANGGKGANQAAAAGKLAGSAIFTGQVGIDDEMKNLKKEMTQANVTLMWKQLPQSHTGKAFIYVDQTTGQNSIVIIGGANIAYTDLHSLSETYKEAIDQCQVLQLQKQIPMSINVLAAQYAKSKGKIVMLDCGGRDDHIPTELLESLDYISPNQTEVLRIDPDVDINNPVEGVRSRIIAKYKNLKVILKLGSKGSMLITDKIHIHANVATKINPHCLEKYKIIDTVGAGDCFTSAFCVKLIECDWTDESKWLNNYRECLIFGNCAAFLCITKKGAMPSMPDRKTTDLFIEEYGMFVEKAVEKVEVQVKVTEGDVAASNPALLTATEAKLEEKQVEEGVAKTQAKPEEAKVTAVETKTEEVKVDAKPEGNAEVKVTETEVKPLGIQVKVGEPAKTTETETKTEEKPTGNLQQEPHQHHHHHHHGHGHHGNHGHHKH